MKLFHLTVILLLTLTNVGWGQTKRPRTLDELRFMQARIASKFC